jgi:hypothetical protein
VLRTSDDVRRTLVGATDTGTKSMSTYCMF